MNELSLNPESQAKAVVSHLQNEMKLKIDIQKNDNKTTQLNKFYPSSLGQNITNLITRQNMLVYLVRFYLEFNAYR